MDEKILIYLALALVYFLFNKLRKNKEESTSNDGQPPRPRSESGTPKKQMTFEDLLREITEGKASEPSPSSNERSVQNPKYTPHPAYVDYDDDLEEEGQSQQQLVLDDERTNQIYEDAKKLAFNRPSLEETLKLQNVNMTYGKFAEFESRKERNMLLGYTKDLHDPNGFKKALILSEVLNRRHF